MKHQRLRCTLSVDRTVAVARSATACTRHPTRICTQASPLHNLTFTDSCLSGRDVSGRSVRPYPVPQVLMPDLAARKAKSELIYCFISFCFEGNSPVS